MAEQGAPVHRLARGGAGYPASLLELESPPADLYAMGDLTALEQSPGRHVAIVGTRKASHYGLRIAEALGQRFAEAGAVVVSGMARGIDAAAHDGALSAGGKTIAVLGTGVDVPYPVGNRGLHRRLIHRGLVVSENAPGRGAYQGCFPRRNRIIAALARVTIVVEAGFKSGALITANLSAAMGRTFAAVPGPIDSPESMGSNQLLRDGAQVIASVEDALSLLGVLKNSTVPNPPMGALEANIWHELGQGPASPDALADRLEVPARALLESVGTLELMGLVVIDPRGRVVRSALLRQTTTMLREGHAAYGASPSGPQRVHSRSRTRAGTGRKSAV
jgi:DNA processing protein